MYQYRLRDSQAHQNLWAKFRRHDSQSFAIRHCRIVMYALHAEILAHMAQIKI